MSSDWKRELREQRDAKDEFFASHPHSPVPSAERNDFDGLAYYPPEEAYRFELPLHEHDETETVTVGTSTGGESEYLRWGEFRFDVAGERVTLQAYKSDPADDRLWVPFRDETSGEATYGAGRYLDLEADSHRTDEDEWILDFNEAYNPTCAYSDEYECPLPPTENWLDVPVEAGEKVFET
ncbi:hypothetical protein SAMN05216559_2798 [Halomicrobium zhouii]|uniref:DUF1684 domain-containing protein n=1 Tax=Halomicrobium zhouii TaxID=767519 RepID=A0A1I6LJ59_9EURY|nr:DUF1684 domain-containing protein [Halomicrobium zhouii]SFS03534.1 hypothetical protein SAMN05216559_2798 [Halomicrobium zhouii]